MTPSRIAELKKLDAEATPGKWYFDGYSKVFSTASDERDDEDFFICQVPVIAGDTGTPTGRLNAALIEAYRTAVPELLAEVERLQKQVENPIAEKHFIELHSQLASARDVVELRLVDVRRYDEESLWLQRHDGEGMQLRITEEWWSANF